MKQEKQDAITFEQLLPHIEEIAAQTNEKYNKELAEARKSAACVMAQQYINSHANATEEEVRLYIEDFIKQSPSEFQRNLRIYVNAFGTMFNLLNQLFSEVNDFKNLFMAVNEQKLTAVANRYAKEARRADEKKAEDTAN